METQPSQGFLGKVQAFIDSMFASLNITAKDIICYTTCFAIGFAAGLLFRRYGKLVVVGTLGAIVVIAGLHYFDLLTVHQSQIRCMLGMSDVQSVSDLIIFGKEKITVFGIEIILVIVAFMLGFKLG